MITALLNKYRSRHHKATEAEDDEKTPSKANYRKICATRFHGEPKKDGGAMLRIADKWSVVYALLRTIRHK